MDHDPKDDGRGRRKRAVPSILIVDDTPANLLALEAVLQPLGCNLVRAQSGEEALRHLLFQSFAAILLDVMMPGLDGFATAGLIRERASTRHLPIIFLTGLETGTVDMAQAYAQGAVDYLVKPFDPDILRSKVSVFVELFKKTQELIEQTELTRKRELEAIENRRLYESERGARAQAEAVARAREDIIAVVSHDLRNPMNAIAMSAQNMLRNTSDPESVTKGLDRILRNVKRMNSLVSDLLDTARIQSGTLAVELREEDCAALLEQVADQMRAVLAAKQQSLQIVVETGCRALCDRERVFQVLSNLIDNATKFSPETSLITVRASERSDDVLFEVIDHGCGIASEQLPNIFEPYWQASQERRQGLGLGLAIARGIIEAHRARMWVESRVGAGTHFFFTLPSVTASSPPDARRHERLDSPGSNGEPDQSRG